MSNDESEPDLKDLLRQALEANGFLPKMQAEIRANVFLALDEGGELLDASRDTKLGSHLTSRDCKLALCLVREFLDFYNLDFTASVYDRETYTGTRYEYNGRAWLADELAPEALIDKTQDSPLLLQILRNVLPTTETDQLTPNKMEVNGNCQSVQPVVRHLNETFCVEETNGNETYDITSTNSEPSSEFSPPIVLKQPDKGKSKKTAGLTSLADLPPLPQLGKSTNRVDPILLPSLYGTVGKPAVRPSRSLAETYPPEVDCEDPMDSYEEDFASDADVNLNNRSMSGEDGLHSTSV